MGSPFPIVHAELFLVFQSFATYLQQLTTALSLVYYNDKIIIIHFHTPQQSTEEYKDACQLWALYEESLAKAPDEVKEKQKQKQQQLDDEEKFSNRKVSFATFQENVSIITTTCLPFCVKLVT